MHHNSSKICPPWTLKATLYFNFKNGGMPFDLPSANPYQQTRAGWHKKLPKNHNMIYQHIFSHWTLIQSQRQKNKTNRHYQEPFEFTLSKMLLFIHQQHQNQMSKLSLTLIFTSDSNLMLLLYFTLVINLGGLEPKHNTLWFHFAL